MQAAPHSAVALAKVILITKDEHDLIGDFLAFYGGLFGRENVVVVDNGSGSAPGAGEAVQAAYREHRAAGGEVRVDARPFVDAVRFMGEHMRSLVGTCEWILPLETDEFLFLMDRADDAGYATAREDVEAALRALPDDVSVLRYGAFLGSSVDPAEAGYRDGAYGRPARQITRFHDQGWDKVIVRASRFEGMAQWCHHAVVSGGVRAVSDRLGLLHFHDAGLRRLVERARPVVESYGYVDPRATLDDYVKHIEHAVQVAGIDHVGVGCDFDGGGGVTGLNDVSEYPNLTAALRARGWNEADLAKFWGGNALRVLGATRA